MRLPVPGRGSLLLLELDLTRPLLETPPSSPLEALRARHVPTLRSVIDALARAAEDDRVAGVVAHVGSRQPSLAQSGELREAIRRFAAAGKSTVCWSESFGEGMGPGNVAYHLASGFEEVWLQPSGELNLVGVSATAVLVRGALDKLGILPQISQRHEYKTAADTFLQTRLTEAHREMLTSIVDSATSAIVSDVADSRGLAEEEVRDAVEAAPLSAQQALQRRLVDRIGYRDDVYRTLRERFGEDVQRRFVERYRTPTAAPRHLAAALLRRRKPVIAVVHATGPIHLGRSRRPSPLSGRSVGSDTLGAALRAVDRDTTVRAVVLRVDSPGGSYAASDAIRREVHALREAGTPVVASMATVAASGGYYISMPADAVVAAPGTLTGSIGVLAGKQVIRDALERVGVHGENVSAAPRAEMSSSLRPFDEEEWHRLEEWLDRVYDDFTTKAAEDRGMPLEDLRRVARGRVWTGIDAAGAGLVDRLGGLSEAVDEACERAGVLRSDVEVKTLPQVSPLQRLMPAQNSDSPGAAAAVTTGADGGPLLERLLATLGLPPDGVLTMPVSWQLH